MITLRSLNGYRKGLGSTLLSSGGTVSAPLLTSGETHFPTDFTQYGTESGTTSSTKFGDGVSVNDWINIGSSLFNTVTGSGGSDNMTTGQYDLLVAQQQATQAALLHQQQQEQKARQTKNLLLGALVVGGIAIGAYVYTNNQKPKSKGRLKGVPTTSNSLNGKRKPRKRRVSTKRRATAKKTSTKRRTTSSNRTSTRRKTTTRRRASNSKNVATITL